MRVVQFQQAGKLYSATHLSRMPVDSLFASHPAGLAVLLPLGLYGLYLMTIKLYHCPHTLSSAAVNRLQRIFPKKLSGG